MLERSLNNSLQETHSIESQLQDRSPEPIPNVDDASHHTLDQYSRDAIERYYSLQRQREPTHP